MAGMSVGVVLLLFHAWVSPLHRLPESFILFMGAANLTYGLFSLSLALRQRRPRVLIRLLSVANVLWGLACCAWLWVYWESASVFGQGQLMLEALFVGGLGVLEWRWQEWLCAHHDDSG